MSHEPLSDTFIRRIIAKVSPDSIRARLQRLQDFRTRYSYTDSCRAAEQYVADYFNSLVLDSVRLDSYPSGNQTWRNPVGTILGRTRPEKVLIICGHMDATSESASTLAPGAEDNGSGTSLTIEAARVLAGESLDYTVRFIGFTGEEIGLNGSDHYAREARANGEEILGVFNFDMVAWPGGSWGVALVGMPAAARLVQYEAQIASTYTTLAHRQSYRSFPSDSRSFDNQGYPATSGYEYGSDPYVWYHTTGDSLVHLSMELCAEITKMAVATVATLARAPLPPEGLALADAGTGSALAATWQANTEPDLAGYKLLWGRTSHGYSDSVVLGRVTSYRIGGLTADSLYYATVVAADSAGNESGTTYEVSATPRAAPLAPANPRALPFRFGMALSWNRNRELDLAGYNLYRRTAGSAYARLNGPVLSDTAYRDSGLLSDTMYYYVATAVDTTGSEGDSSAEVRGKPITLDHGILLVDETRNGNGQPGNPSDAQVDAFYHAALAGFSFSDWDVTEQGIPMAGDVGPYSTVVWHGDDYSQQQVFPALEGLANYLKHGGKLWLGGWKPVFGLMNGTGAYPYTFSAGQFAYDQLHLDAAFQQSQHDFAGADGVNGYPPATVDSAKLYPSAHGRLPYVDAFAPRDAETILTFNSFSGDTFDNRPVGIRRLGTPGKVIFFGFPFYYVKDAEARPLAVKVLTDLGEPYGIEEMPKSEVRTTKSLPTIIRNILFLPPSSLILHPSSLLDVSGRRVLSLHSGRNDLRGLAPGVYFVRMENGEKRQDLRLVLVR